MWLSTVSYTARVSAGRSKDGPHPQNHSTVAMTTRENSIPSLLDNATGHRSGAAIRALVAQIQ
jgi:hypothetical protein